MTRAFRRWHTARTAPVARFLAALLFLTVGAAVPARAQIAGRKCERNAPDDLCWRCADIRDSFNRICSPDPCAPEEICVEVGDVPRCLMPRTVCCEEPCTRPPGCEGFTSSCSGPGGDTLTCTFYGNCPPLPAPDASTAPRDAGPPAPDAGLRDAGPRDAGPRDAGPRDAGRRDAGRAEMDGGGAPPFDAGNVAPTLQPGFRGGGGCACRASASSRSAPGPVALALLAGSVFAARRRRRRSH